MDPDGETDAKVSRSRQRGKAVHSGAPRRFSIARQFTSHRIPRVECCTSSINSRKTRCGLHAPPPKPTARGLGVARSAAKKRLRMEPSARIRTMALDPASRRAVYGTGEGNVCLIDIDHPAVIKLNFVGHQSSICSLDFHPSKPLLLSSSLDRTIRLWDLHSGEVSIRK